MPKICLIIHLILHARDTLLHVRQQIIMNKAHRQFQPECLKIFSENAKKVKKAFKPSSYRKIGEKNFPQNSLFRKKFVKNEIWGKKIVEKKFFGKKNWKKILNFFFQLQVTIPSAYHVQISSCLDYCITLS